jgi:hypothetical protein
MQRAWRTELQKSDPAAHVIIENQRIRGNMQQSVTIPLSIYMPGTDIERSFVSEIVALDKTFELTSAEDTERDSKKYSSLPFQEKNRYTHELSRIVYTHLEKLLELYISDDSKT